jgi:CheY-like chemotaxis protein
MGRTTNILVVEDDDICMMNVRRACAKGKITSPLFHAEDGIRALEMLRDGTFPEERRLVLLDLHMPRMDGLTFLQELRADPELRGVPVVMLTTSNQDRDRVAAWGLNVAGYLLKPVDSAAFIELMATLNSYWTMMEMT